MSSSTGSGSPQASARLFCVFKASTVARMRRGLSGWPGAQYSAQRKSVNNFHVMRARWQGSIRSGRIQIREVRTGCVSGKAEP